MELSLYAPGLGYYSAGARKFGMAGDFTTAPELSPLFSGCVATQCAEIMAALGQGDILELGAGSGAMAVGVLDKLLQLGQLPTRYFILEISADLRERQHQALAERVPALLPKVFWLERLPQEFSGVIVGNELLDALPVSRFCRAAGSVHELCVSHDHEAFVWRRRAMSTELSAAITALEITLPEPLADGYCSEICLGLSRFLHTLAALLTRGALLFVDYGYTREAYYHRARFLGTLMCHYRQRAHDNPFLFPGLQDITAHVDFTAVAEAATAAGLTLAGYTTQAHFLLALGIAAEAHDWRTAREVKLLTLPEEMGERFKAIAFVKGLDVALRGFDLLDLSHTL